MSTGLKVWLWFVLVCNAIVAILCIPAMLVSPTSIFSLIMEIVLIFGVVLLLFKQRKLGFYLMSGVAIAVAIFNIMIGLNIIGTLIGAVITPAITYLLMKKNWDEFE